MITSRIRALSYVGVVALAIGAAEPSLRNGFALDDVALIADNARVHTLDAWWRLFTLPYWPPQFGASLYRPIVTLAYAGQWMAGHGAPLAFHLTSIALYALASALVLALFLAVLPTPAAFIAASLFAVHPVHVEAVGNVVGQCELIAAVAMLAAAVLYTRRRQRGAFTATDVVTIGVLFALACLSKEHALLLPALLIALEVFAAFPRSDEDPPIGWRDRARAIAPVFVTLAAVGAAYVVVRTVVLGGVLGEQHLVPVNGAARFLVMLAVVPHWVRLLAWPAQLSADYSPQHIRIPTGLDAQTALGVAILAAAGAMFVALDKGAPETRSERGAARLGLAWLAVSLLPVSNLFSVMLVAERTLFVPSVGAMLVVGAAATAIARRGASSRPTWGVRVAIPACSAVLVALGVARSRERQPAWRDDATLFARTVEDAPLSYRAQFFFGQMLFAQGKRAEGERHLRRAIALNPTPSDVSPLNYLATQYRDAGLCVQALPLYQRALANAPGRPDVRYGLAACLLETGRRDEARRLAEDGVRRGALGSLFRDLVARSGP